MTLLNPLALAFGALVPLIVALYLLKLRRQQASVSTLMFWQMITADRRRRALFQRLRQILSLLLQLLIFTLLLFALARPELAAFRGTGNGLLVVVLDARARLQATTSGGETRFAQARRLAESYLRRASPSQPVALLVVTSAPRVLVGFSGDERALLDGLAPVRPTDAGGRLEDGVRLAADLLAARVGSRRIIVITDQPPALDKDTLGSVEVETHLIPAATATPCENVGLTRLTARPLPNSPETDEVFVELENFGAHRQSGEVELSFEGRLIDVKPFDLAPGERRADTYPALGARSGLLNARGWLTARLHLNGDVAKNDSLTLDDRAFAVVPPPRPLHVLLVTKGNWFFENLLKSDDRVQAEQLTPEAFQPAQAERFDAVILDDFLPAGFTNPATLPAGNFLCVGQAPFAAADPPALEHPVITDVDAANPVLYLVQLREATILRAHNWLLPTPAVADANAWRFAAPVRAIDQPLVVTGERRGTGNHMQRLVALAFSAADSDLPLRVAFPLLIHNALGFLAGRDDAGEMQSREMRCGETVTLAAGETLWTHPQTSYVPLPAGGIPATERLTGPAVFEPTQNGFYLRRDAAGGDSWLAVNTSDRAMSALNALAQTSSESTSVSSPKKSAAYVTPGHWWDALAIWPPWIELALLAAVLCALEWLGFHRRRTE